MSTDPSPHASTLTSGMPLPARIQMLSAHSFDECLHDLGAWLDEALACNQLDGDSTEMLLVHPACSGGAWLCRCCYHAAPSTLRIVRADMPDHMLSAFAYPMNEFQFEDTQDSYDRFLAFAPQLFAPADTGTVKRLLRVKVHRDLLWFMKFPLDLYVKFDMPAFRPYSACQWLVTDRTLPEVAAAQRRTEYEIADTLAFARGAVIMVNTYAAHLHAEDATTLAPHWVLLRELMESCTSIPLADATVQLRWAWNPSPTEVTSLLLDPATRFVYANFEAASGAWVTGDLPSAFSPGSGPLYAPPGPVDLRALAGRLSHVALLRVFHCNSLFNAGELDSTPVHAQSLGTQLLATAAWFVEGSMNEETATDFIAVLYRSLLAREDLQYLLFGKQFSGGRPLEQILVQANELVVARGLPPIPCAIDALG